MRESPPGRRCGSKDGDRTRELRVGSCTRPTARERPTCVAAFAGAHPTHAGRGLYRLCGQASLGRRFVASQGKPRRIGGSTPPGSRLATGNFQSPTKCKPTPGAPRPKRLARSRPRSDESGAVLAVGNGQRDGGDAAVRSFARTVSVPAGSPNSSPAARGGGARSSLRGA